jgi:hypothetical protein
VRTGLTAFRSLYGLAKNNAGTSDFWSEVQPGELRFHFAAYYAALTFVVHCVNKQFDITFRDNSKSGAPHSLEGLPKRQRDFSLMEKKTPEMRTYPMRLELAGYYSDDATDFLRRYRLTFYSEEVDFQGVKSRRTKAYVDLRMALEALLKATICLRAPFALAGKPLVDKIRSYSHRIDQLAADALRGVRVDPQYIVAIGKCRIAPVDLRYQFDAMNFRIPDDRNYYDTIGSSDWLKIIEEFIEQGTRRLRAALGRRSKVVSGSVAASELSRPSDY